MQGREPLGLSSGCSSRRAAPLQAKFLQTNRRQVPEARRGEAPPQELIWFIKEFAQPASRREAGPFNVERLGCDKASASSSTR